MKILQGLVLKHIYILLILKARLYLIDFKFPAKHAGCHLSFISGVTPTIPIYLFSFCIKTIISFLEFRHNG
jgi:hypothetical protein